MITMQHEGYIAKIEYDAELEMFHGLVINTHDVVTFYGKSVAELKKEFAASMKAHFEFCRKKGLNPSKPFSGHLTVRIPPELHGAIVTTAARMGKSLNAWINETFQHELQRMA